MLPSDRFRAALKNLFINNTLFTFRHDNRITNRRMSRSM